jgi:hypothetical protein
MSKLETIKLFNSMEGAFEMSRSFSLPASALDVPRAKGLAVFKRINQATGILIYFEEIKLYWPNGKVNECRQSYLYQFKDGIISKYQHNKNIDITPETINEHTKMYELAFCPMDKTNHAKARGFFRCEQDSYLAKFRFKDPNNFNINYSVSGPYKKYETYSEYIRIP